jgi:hypothetical protein
MFRTALVNKSRSSDWRVLQIKFGKRGATREVVIPVNVVYGKEHI